MAIQDAGDLRQHLHEQFGFLVLSARAFDAGAEAEAKRLATTIRVVFHQTNRSKALLQQLNVLQCLCMVDSAKPPVPGNLIDIGRLTCMGIGGLAGAQLHARSHPEFYPLMGFPSLPFAAWWNAEAIRDRRGKVFSRRDVVLALANKDGGAHVDQDLGCDYGRLRKHNSMGWEFAIDGSAVDGIIEGTIRQIAHEVFCSIAPLRIS